MLDDGSAAATRPSFPGARVATRCTLGVHRLELDVRLGCDAEERSRPQKVELDATLRFAATPLACRTDRLDDAVCYAELAAIARECASAREYRLVEHLGHEIYAACRRRLPDHTSLSLVVRKVAPPIGGLRGGVSFAIEEELPE
jgi:dihydroneopterin aldolase